MIASAKVRERSSPPLEHVRDTMIASAKVRERSLPPLERVRDNCLCKGA